MSSDTTPRLETKKLFHHRSDSGELDVFEAARYFSGAGENFPSTQNRFGDESRTFGTTLQKDYMKQGVRRMSLDIAPHRGNSIPLQASMMMESHPKVIKNDKYKQPSSPGGKLAHFLNSLFSQTSSKKSKSKQKSKPTAQSMREEDESPGGGGWRRRRRSSISHFRSGNTTTTIVSDYKTLFPNSGSRPTKTAACLTHKPACEVTKVPIIGNSHKNETFETKSEFPEKKRGLVEKMRNCDEKHEDDDDGDSDSSSDLFELRNCDLSYYASGLPVYETTHMETIKRGAPISS